jgi:O-antigen/teichoic acid export membrane protein
LKGVLSIAGGTAIAQAITVLTAPILTRLYTPEQMGVWGLFLSFVGVASIAATLRYDLAIVAANSDADANALTKSCLILTAACAPVSALVLEALRRAGSFHYSDLPGWAPACAAIAVFGSACGSTLRFYAARLSAFTLVGRFTVLQAVARPVLQVLLSPLGTLGLLGGEAAGRCIGLSAYRKHLGNLRHTTSLTRTLVIYRQFPLIQLPSSLLSTAALLAQVPVFASIYGTQIAGYLALSQRVVAMPVALLGSAIADVFYARAGDLARTEPALLRRYVLRTAAHLLLLILPLAAALLIAGPHLVAAIFGDAWAPSGQILCIFAPLMVVQFTVSSVSRAIYLTQKQHFRLLYDIAALCAQFLILLIKPEDWRSAVYILSYSGTALYVVFFLVLLHTLQPQAIRTGTTASNP